MSFGIVASGFDCFGSGLGFARGAFAFQVSLAAMTFLNLVALLSHIKLYIRGLFRLCSGTMDTKRRRFNIYLLAAAACILFSGCATSKPKKIETVLQVHAAGTDKAIFTKKVKLFRDAPMEMRVEESPLLTGVDVKKATVVEALGGFALKIEFEARGRWILDSHSSLNIGKNLVIFAKFGEEPGVSRWIAAPIISNRISDGALIFTPDTTREEAELIAKGLGEQEDPKAKKKKKEEPAPE